MIEQATSGDIESGAGASATAPPMSVYRSVRKTLDCIQEKNRDIALAVGKTKKLCNSLPGDLDRKINDLKDLVRDARDAEKSDSDVSYIARTTISMLLYIMINVCMNKTELE